MHGPGQFQKRQRLMFREATHDLLAAGGAYGLGKEDLNRGSIECHRIYRQKFIPTFKNNLEQFRHVLVVRAWHFLFNNAPVPDRDVLVRDFKALDLRCGEHAARLYRQEPSAENKSLVRATNFAGTYLLGQAVLCWRSWTLGEHAPAIAAEFGLTVGFVYRNLKAIIRTAEQLGYSTYSVRNFRHGKKKPRIKKTREEISAAQSAGHKAAYAAHPEMIEKVRAATTERYRDPKERERTGATSSAVWERPEYREKCVASMRATHQRPEVRALKSAAAKAAWARRKAAAPEHGLDILQAV
jgi:hypothetical protein